MSKITEQLKKFSEYSVEDQERILKMAEIAIPCQGGNTGSANVLKSYVEILNNVKPPFFLRSDSSIDNSSFVPTGDSVENYNHVNVPRFVDATHLYAVVQEINVAEYIYQKYNYTERPLGIGSCYHIGMREDKEVAVSAWLAAYSGNPRFYQKEHCQEAIDILLNIDPEWGIKRFKA